MTVGWGQERAKLFAAPFFLPGGIWVSRPAGELCGQHLPRGALSYPPGDRCKLSLLWHLAEVCWELRWQLLQLSLHGQSAPHALAVPISQMRK